MRKITIIGGGSIGTALGNSLTLNKNQQIRIHSIEKDVVHTINKEHVNYKYFPGFKLNTNLKAYYSNDIIKESSILVLALPSAVTVNYLESIKYYIPGDAILINLAKGFGNENKTIVECLKEIFPGNIICSFKGPSFAREIMENAPTAFTFASENNEIFKDVEEFFKNTNIYVDYSEDLTGVELLSILKNIYAIAIGIIDARFNSPNMRFLVLTKAFKEMREILIQFGGNEETLFKYCGFGDFTLTALNDLSRNRTLGLFIGKGFYSKDISEKVLLEGKIATRIFCEKISKNNSLKNYRIIKELYKVFNAETDIADFTDKILNS